MSYALVKIADASIFTEYAGDRPPGVITWPNGDITHAPSLGDERVGYRFVSIEYAPDRPGEFYEIKGTAPKLDKAVLTYVRDWQPVDLDFVKSVLIGRVDAEAEKVRLRYITPGSGQAMVYMQKLAESQRFAGDAKPLPENYPLLAASAPDLATAAAAVTATAAAWLSVAADIEKTRFAAKDAVNSAKSVDDAVAIERAIQWG